MASKCDCCAVRVQIVVIVMIAMTGQLMAINRKLDSSSIGLNIERSNKLLTPNMLPLSEDDAESKGRNWIGNLPSTISFNPRFNRDAGIDPDSDPQLLKDLVDQWLNGQNFLRKEQFFVDRVWVQFNSIVEPVELENNVFNLIALFWFLIFHAEIRCLDLPNEGTTNWSSICCTWNRKCTGQKRAKVTIHEFSRIFFWVLAVDSLAWSTFKTLD